MKVTQLCLTLCDPVEYTVHGQPSLLQGIFPTQESNPGLPHYRQILYVETVVISVRHNIGENACTVANWMLTKNVSNPQLFKIW